MADPADSVSDAQTTARPVSNFAERALPLAAVVIGILLILGPFAATVVRSALVFDAGGATLSSALSWRNFSGLFADPRFYQAAANTAVCGLAATVVSGVLGLGLAWVVARTDLPGKRWFEIVNLVPFFLSPYVGAISWVWLAAPYSGLLNRLMADTFGLPPDVIPVYGITGAAWVLALFYTPYVYLFVLAPMQQMDPALEDAARVHGAGFWTTLRLVTIPLLLPALLSAALIVFVTSAGLFDVPLALMSPRGIRAVPTEIYQLVQYPSDLGRASAFGVVAMTVTVLLTVLQRRYLDRRRFVTVTGKGYRPRVIALGTAGRAAALAFEILYVGCAVVLPVAALVMVSLSPVWTGTFSAAAVTWHNFDYVLSGYALTRQAVLNSLLLAVSGATLGVTISALQAYYVHRSTGRRRTAIDAILSLPIGTPGIILGLGFLILAVRTPLYATLTILLIAYVAHFFPFATRAVAAALTAINPELEHSARASGASWLQAMRHVVVPLVRPAVAAAWLMLFVVFVRELGASILLYADGTETISVALVLLSERSTGYVAALAVVQLLLLLVAVVFFRTTRASLVQT
jgi:iron(III) transport system permease protein